MLPEEKGDNKMGDIYLLTYEDIMQIEGCSYGAALNKFRKHKDKVIHINQKPYILADEYYKNDRKKSKVGIFYEEQKGMITKVIVKYPTLFAVEDIMEIFKCGTKHAYQIMNAILYSFKINHKLYIKQDDFEVWLNEIKGKKISIK